jgi:hypothetical protein
MRLISVMPSTAEGRQLSARGERELLVRQDRERQMQPLGRLALIVGRLGREAEELRDARALQVGEVIAKAAGLRRAAARAGNAVPAGRRRLPGRPVRG